MTEGDLITVSREQLEDLVSSAVSAALDAQAAAREADRQAAADAVKALDLRRWFHHMAAFFEGLGAAIEAYRRAEVEAHAMRTVKVAVFDPAGVCIGVQESAADALAYQLGDEYTRLAWRPEWDGPQVVELVRDGGVGETGPVMRLRQTHRMPVPDLSALPVDEVGAELIGQAMSVLATNVLLS